MKLTSSPVSKFFDHEIRPEPLDGVLGFRAVVRNDDALTGG